MYALECPECGAPAPTPPDRVCSYCKYQFPVAAGAHAQDGFGLNWLLDRARAALNALPGVLLGPAIDARASSEARRSFARNALPDETLVVVYDPGRAMDGVGWAITQRRFCWSSLEGPKDIEWRALSAGAIVHMHPSLTVGGSEVPASDLAVTRALAELLRLLATCASGLPAAPQQAPKFSDDMLLEGLRRALGNAAGLRCWPDVSPEREQSAREAHGPEIEPAARVLALYGYESSWLGGTGDGWMLTSRRVYSHSAQWGTSSVELARIVAEGVSVQHDYVSVQMKVALMVPEEQRGPLAAFFRTLAKY